MKNPQVIFWNEERIIRKIPPNNNIVNIEPNENAKLCFLIFVFDKLDDFRRENIFIEIIGNTQGIKFNIIPPNSEKNNINNIFCDKGSVFIYLSISSGFNLLLRTNSPVLSQGIQEFSLHFT